jgi:hypothetical protein
VLTRDRLVVLIAAAGLTTVSIVRPVNSADAGAATQFTVALFAALLTGEAVVFALSFSAASAWPSLRDIDRHILFRHWVLVGAVAATAIAAGLLWHLPLAATFGALSFLAANVLGVYSFIRLFGIASAGGRATLLSRILADALRDPAGPDGASVVEAYLSALDQVLNSGDPAAIRALVGQLIAAAPGPEWPDEAYAVHLTVIRSLARALLLRGGDPNVLGDCVDEVVHSVVHSARHRPDADGPLGALGRQLAWLARIARTLTAREACDPRAARQLIVRCSIARLVLMRVMDPDPMSPESDDEIGTPFPDALRLLTWLRGFSEYSGAHHPTAFYGAYEILAGRKFHGDYLYGDSILGRLREDLYGPVPLSEAAAGASRAAFGTVSEFDMFWCRLSVNAIATMNDVRLPVPAEFADPVALHGPLRVACELRTYAAHRWFGTAAEAMGLLMRLASQAPEPGSLWVRTGARLAAHGYDRLPRTAEFLRPAAMVLAVACRLAPLEPADNDAQLAEFLELLPPPVLAAAAVLASRVLPGAAEQPSPRQQIIVGLRALMEIGAHISGAR